MSDGFTKLFQQMLQSGQEMARAFNPALEKFDPRALEKMFPTMSADMMEMWFGRTFNREGLDAKTRLLLTIGALHGQREIAETIWQMSMFGGLPAMQKALELAQSVFAEEDDAS